MNVTSPEIIAGLLRDSLTQGQPTTLQVTSNSMAPLLRAGDKVQLTAVATPQPGMILTFVSANNLQTHRCWRQDGGKVIMRGDRPLLFDPPVREQDLVGQVIGRERNGRLLAFTSGPGAWLNRHLWALARLEGKLFAGKTGRRWGIRLLRRGVYSWAWGITAVVGLFAK